MGKMTKWLQQFQQFAAGARDASERENLLCEMDDIKIMRQDLTCREIEIMRILRRMGHAPAVVEPCNAIEAQRTFSARYPELAEELRQPSQACSILPFGRNEVRSVKP